MVAKKNSMSTRLRGSRGNRPRSSGAGAGAHPVPQFSSESCYAYGPIMIRLSQSMPG